MRILDKYILRELIGPFIFGICAFSSIFIGTSTLFRIAQYVTKYGASITSVIKLFIFSLPSIVVLTFPMSMLLAALLSFGRLSASSEVTAMKSGGLSFYRLSAPVFMVAFLVSLFSTVFYETVVPAANTAQNNVIHYEIMRNNRPSSQEHLVIKDVKAGNIERLTYVRKFDEDTSTMYGVTVQDFAGDNLIRMENAEKAVWEKDQWTMYNGVVHDLTPEGRVERSLKFKKQLMPVEKNPTEIVREQKNPGDMTIKELKQQIKVLQTQFVRTSNHEVELHQRLSIPMASFVFALIGTPLGLQPHRSSSSIGFGISVIVIFIYYTIMTVTAALGQGGAL